MTEGLGHHGNGENAQFTGNGTNHRSGSRTRTASHTGGNEDHVGTLHGLLQVFHVFFGSLATNFGLSTRTKTLRSLLANGNLMVCLTFVKSHGIRIDGVVFHAFNVHADHAVHGVATGSAYAEDLDLRGVEG